MTKTLNTILITLIFTPLAGMSADEKVYEQLPRLDEVRAYFTEHQARLNALFEFYATNDRIDWLQCASNGEHRVTSVFHDKKFIPDPAQSKMFSESCAALDTMLVQRVESGISVLWKDVQAGSKSFRIELYSANTSIEDSCLHHRFESPISSCMLPLDARWHVRYIGIVKREP